MLNTHDNRMVTQTGPGTPMGEYLRRFWLPALTSEELPSPDCPPIRTTIVGENLVGYRDTDGKVGLFTEACPHRGASMFFGRNEEGGLRCVYHGWKFDLTGACVDMPSEPPESNFKEKVRITAYPTIEAGGFVWAYMGPAELKPNFPAYEFTLVDDSHRHVSRRLQECNYLQGIEGGIDSSHVSYLHSPAYDARKQGQVGINKYSVQDGAPRLTVQKKPYGFAYGAQRDGEDDSYYWRLTPFMLPFFTVIPGALENYEKLTYSGHGWMPADDNSCWMFSYSWNFSRPLNEGEGHPAHYVTLEPRTLRATDNKDNDYGIDREDQKHRSFTGIANGSIQDSSIQESMGAIFDRTKEHLGTTDTAIIYLRRLYLQGCRDVLEGAEPFVPQNASDFRVRSVSTLLDRDVAFEDGLKFMDVPTGAKS